MMTEPFHKARPREMRVPLLTNPGKGCATFQRFNGDPLNPGETWSEEGPLVFPPATRLVAEDYLPSTVSYCRWFWDVLEPNWSRVVAEFGHRFDGHPDLESVDIAFIGPWGEGAGEIRNETVDRFVDLYVRSHPKTPLLINSDGYQLQSGARRGCGWRCDCFGDLRGRKEAAGKEYLAWNHTYDFYPQAVARAGAADLWKMRPVVFETCATPLGWRNRWYAGIEDLELIIRQGLKFHASVFMPKSSPIPPEYMAPLAGFCDRMGYRFVLRQALWQSLVGKTGTIETEFWIENTGCAPAYRDYRLALRLAGAGREAVVPVDSGVRSWLPGDAVIEKKITLPGGLPAGEFKMSAGLIRPDEDRPAVRFANEGADPDGWLPLGPVRKE